ncbi:MAG TPA: ABC transporter substrate-binding protein [Patescibacteria group bacterium]|nr:ABC transporter substrate-binding protein [Patescibacteria group bacterium]
MMYIKNLVIDRFGRLPVLLVILIVGSLLLMGCGQKDEPATIRLALLPILDALPMYVAEEQGYFADENLTVEFIPVTSAAERDQLIQAGRADGMINEILSTLFYNVGEPQITIVGYARVATPEYPQFRILASADSGINSLEDLVGQPIGISEGTIIEYSTDRLLEAEGLDADDISTIAVPRIPDRLALLNSGELAAANLPDPLASLAMQNGAKVIVDDSSHPEYGHSVIAFRNEIIEENPDAIRRFLAAIERAVEDINNDKEQFSNVLVERNLVPEPILGSYSVPDFPEPSVPPISQWEDVLAWAINKGYIEAELDYNDSVDDSYLP